MSAPYDLGSGSAELNWNIHKAIGRMDKARQFREAIKEFGWEHAHNFDSKNRCCRRCLKTAAEINCMDDPLEQIKCHSHLTLQT